jgi:hypothetical protein
MNKLLLSLVPLVWAATGIAVAETDGSKALPAGAALACQQSVDDFGDRDRKPFSIHWESYSVKQDVSATAKFYEQRFGRPPDQDRNGGFEWKFDGGLIYAIYPITSNTPWLECLESRESISAVILISEGGSKASK